MTDWLTEAELEELTGIPAALLARGAAAGLFEGLTTTVDGERRYAPDVASLVAWSDRLGDDVAAGRIGAERAKAMLWLRARQTRRRLDSLKRQFVHRSA